MTYTPAVMTVTEAAKLLRMAPATAYRHISHGTFPVRVVKAGGRITVPTKPLLDLLGLDTLPDDLSTEEKAAC